LAGFRHAGLVDAHCTAMRKLNRPNWQVFTQGLESFSGVDFRGLSLAARSRK
jgi:hypothetical protein